MQLCISFGTCYTATLTPWGKGGQTQTYFTATPTQKSKHSCSMCSACASAGKVAGKGGVVQARPTVAHFTLECGRREASVAHYGQPSCSLSWLPLSIFAVGKTLFASFVDFVRRTAEVIYLPFPKLTPFLYFLDCATGFLQRLLQLQATHFNLFLCGFLCCFCCAFECITWACNTDKTQFEISVCFRFRRENRAKETQADRSNNCRTMLLLLWLK